MAGRTDTETSRTQLELADLSHYADLSRVDLFHTSLRGANLERVKLPGANLERVNLEGAVLNGAQMRGAFLLDANLKVASLNYAQLQGAVLNRTQLQGATILGADLDGAYVVVTQLAGALLDGASLRGVYLDHADLSGASLKNANFQGARLIDASFAGAILQGAQLDGTDLNGSSLDTTDISGASVWRAKNAKCSAHAGKVLIKALSPQAVEDLIRRSTEKIGNPRAKRNAIERMRNGLSADPARDLAIEHSWTKCDEDLQIAPRDFLAIHAKFLANLVCRDRYDSYDSVAIAAGIVGPVTVEGGGGVRRLRTVRLQTEEEGKSYEFEPHAMSEDEWSAFVGIVAKDGRPCSGASMSDDMRTQLRLLLTRLSHR